jgi:hypothetical protein
VIRSLSPKTDLMLSAGMALAGSADEIDRRRLLRGFVRGSRSVITIATGLTLIPRKGICQSDEQSQYFEVARRIFLRSSSVLLFSLPERLYAGGADLTLEKLGPPSSPKEVSENFREFLISKLTDQSSYLFGVRKATRFYADRGLIFQGSGTRNAFLISTDFEGGRLVLDRPLSPRVFIVNLDPIFPRLLEELGRSAQ